MNKLWLVALDSDPYEVTPRHDEAPEATALLESLMDRAGDIDDDQAAWLSALGYVE